MFEDIELMLPERVCAIDFTVLKETRSWIYNKNCPRKSRIFVVLPNGEMLYKDLPGIIPYRTQKYFVEFIFRDGSSKTYRMWRGTFIQFHLDLYKYLDEKKTNTLAEANNIAED